MTGNVDGNDAKLVVAAAAVEVGKEIGAKNGDENIVVIAGAVLDRITP